MKNLVCVHLTAFEISVRITIPFDIVVNTMTSVVTFKKRRNKKKHKKSAKLRASSLFSACSDSASGELNTDCKPLDAYQHSIQHMLTKQQNGLDSLNENARKDIDDAIAAYNNLGDETVKIKKKRENLDKANNTSKYIDKLLCTAKSREVRNSIAKERMIKKRQDADSAIYGATEEYFSEAYKHKLAEQEKEEKILYSKGFLKSVSSTYPETQRESGSNTQKIDIGTNIEHTALKIAHDQTSSNAVVINRVEMSIETKLELAKRKYKERQRTRRRNNINF